MLHLPKTKNSALRSPPNTCECYADCPEHTLTMACLRDTERTQMTQGCLIYLLVNLWGKVWNPTEFP